MKLDHRKHPTSSKRRLRGTLHVLLFRDPDEGRMVGIVFDPAEPCRGLRPRKLGSRHIEFGENSWRGDRFEARLRKAIVDQNVIFKANANTVPEVPWAIERPSSSSTGTCVSPTVYVHWHRRRLSQRGSVNSRLT